MTARPPATGTDVLTPDDDLYNFLRVSHNTDGTLDSDAAQAAFGGSLAFGPLVTNGAGHAFLTATNDGAQGDPVGSSQLIAFAANFNSQTDPIMYWGYNLDTDGTPLLTSEPAAAWGIEGHWWDLSVHRTETYFQWKSPDSSINIRPLYITINRVTQQSESFIARAAQFEYDYDPGSGGAAKPAFRVNHNQAYFLADASDNTVYISSAVGFNTKLALGAGGTDSIVVLRTASATQGAFDVASTTVLRFFKAGTGGTLCVGGTQDNGGILVADNTNVGATWPLFKGRANASQSADMVKLYASDGATVYGGFDKSGYFNTRKNAAPADGDLAAGQAMLWFDSTNGAAKLMVKAKQTDGTVKTATVALA